MKRSNPLKAKSSPLFVQHDVTEQEEHKIIRK